MKSVIWPEGTERVLDSLSEESLIGDYVFVGGSYYLKHRLSEDVGLFTHEESLKNENINAIMNSMVKKGYYIEDVGVPFSRTHRKFLVLGIKVEFAAVGRDFLANEKNILKNNLKIASIETITGMKAFTITQRKETRDLYDNYILAEKFGIEHLIQRAENLYGGLFSQKSFLSALVGANKIFQDDYIEERLSPKVKISKDEMCVSFKGKIEEYLKNTLSKEEGGGNGKLEGL